MTQPTVVCLQPCLSLTDSRSSSSAAATDSVLSSTPPSDGTKRKTLSTLSRPDANPTQSNHSFLSTRSLARWTDGWILAHNHQQTSRLTDAAGSKRAKAVNKGLQTVWPTTSPSRISPSRLGDSPAISSRIPGTSVGLYRRSLPRPPPYDGDPRSSVPLHAGYPNRSALESLARPCMLFQ